MRNRNLIPFATFAAFVLTMLCGCTLTTGPGYSPCPPDVASSPGCRPSDYRVGVWYGYQQHCPPSFFLPHHHAAPPPDDGPPE